MTSLIPIILCFAFLSSGFAKAEDNNISPLYRLDGLIGKTALSKGMADTLYEPEFPLFSRSILGRAPPGVTGLLNNVRENRNVSPGTLQPFVFEAMRMFEDSQTQRSDLVAELKPRDAENRPSAAMNDVLAEDDDDGSHRDEPLLQPRQQQEKTVYISANTCLQPQRNANNTSTDPPQPTLYISTADDNQFPGPEQDMSKQMIRVFDEGAVTYSFKSTKDVFFGIYAPPLTDGMFQGEWNVDIAVSTDTFYHNYDKSPAAVYWVDSDSTAALLQTPNLTHTSDADTVQRIMDNGPQYVMFLENQQGWATKGVRHSMCGLSYYAQMAARTSSQFGEKASTILTTRGPGGLPKQQFYFGGLNSSSQYWGILAYTGEETLKRQFPNRAGGGGRVYQAMEFETKTGDNCKIVTNLDFCNETEYAVPANDKRFSIGDLGKFYDDYAKNVYANFEKQLAQVACEAPPTQAYSVIRNCTNCRISYKKWLCSVAIPRCEDYSGDNAWGMVRAVDKPFPNGTRLPEEIVAGFNRSRNQASRAERIDTDVAPGPYKEILPCIDLCHDLVRDCPASLGFNCPRQSQSQFESSYQIRDVSQGLTCNYPGSVRNPSLASGVTVPWTLVLLLLACTFEMTWS